MAAKSPIQHWNYLREHSTLRGAISFRIDSLHNETLTDVAKKIPVNPHKIRRYLRAETPSLNDYELIKLCNILGLDIDIDIKPLSMPTPS